MSHTCGNRCCSCKLCGCCGKRGATIFFALVGLVLAAGVIVPPVYVHETDRNYEQLFPILSYGREYLDHVTKEYFKTNEDQKYKYESSGQFPVDEVAASTIEDLEMKKQNVHNVRTHQEVGDQSNIQQMSTKTGLKSYKNEARNNYK